MKKIIFSIIAAVMFYASAFSQTDLTLQLTLRDGNTMSGTSTMPNVSLNTDYGKLEIPLKNVSSIDVGIGSDKTIKDKVSGLVKQLANTNEQLRKSAYDELVKMNIKAIPAISDFIYSDKYESTEYTDYTAESALSELKSIHNVDDNFSAKDIITIDGEYRMPGLYDFAKIDLKTEYGMLSIPKEKITRIDILFTGSDNAGEKSFKLLASKHISSNTNGGWLKTGITVKSGQKISITASGEVVFASLSNSKYKPDGKIVSGSGTDDLGGDYGDYGSGSTYPVYGNVVYKIGENGTALKAGAKYNGTANSSGMLYISIYETVYNSANTGSYNVKVSTK